MKQNNLLKKTFALLLTIVMGLSIITGCSNKDDVEKTDNNVETNQNKEEKQPSEDNTKKLKKVTMLYADSPSYPYKEDWLALTEIKERTGVELELEVVPGSDFTERRTIVFNSGSMPDIIAKTFGGDITSYVSSGIFLPISDYVDKMPNFKAFVDKYDYEDDLDYTREKDGKYYSLPVCSNSQRVTLHSWLARVDQFEELGIESPETMEDVYEACKMYKEKYPDNYPITNRFGSNNIVSLVASAYNTLGGWTLGNMFMYQEDTDSFEFAPTSNEYKEMLIWFNKMYEEALLDVEFTTLDSTVYEERAKDGKQFIMADYIDNEIRYNKAGPEQSGNENFNIQPIMPPKGPEGYYAGSAIPKSEQGWVINAEVAERDDFDEFLAFVDWFYSDEAAEVLSFGVEGETFEVLDDGRKEYIDIEKDFPKEYGINNNCLTVRRDDDFFHSRRTDYVIDLYDQMIEAGVFTPKLPAPKLTEDEKEIESLYLTSLKDYVNQMTEKFIFGVESLDDDWDNFVEECESKGRPKLDELYNNAWQNQ